MSNVVSPRGPLPPRVYWRRRLVVLLVLVGLVVLVGRLLWGGDDTEPVAERGSDRATAPAQAPTPTAGSGKKPDASGDATRRRPERRKPARPTPADDPAVSLTGAAGPLAQPAGPCDASDVAIVPDVEDTDARGEVPLRLGLSSRGRQACTFSFAPDTVALRVTSGDELIWETLKCGRAIGEQAVTVRPGWLTYVTVPWSGRRDDEGCARTGDFAAPGFYWAEAAPVGGEPERSQFELETPPPPPEPKPKSKKEQRPSAGAGSADQDAAGHTQRARRNGEDETQRREAEEETQRRETDREAQQPRPRQREREPVRTGEAGG